MKHYLQIKNEEAPREQQLNQKETAEINNLKNDQKNLAKRLNTTARNGSDIINEATKNPFFTPEILQEFASSLSEIKETSTGSMRKSEKQPMMPPPRTHQMQVNR